MTEPPRVSAREDPLTARLLEWHVAAGAPSVRTIAAGITGVGHSTVANALGGRLTSWRALSEIVRYLQGDLDEARTLWAASRTVAAPEPEVAALGAAVRALGGLDQPAQRRVMAYLDDRFGELPESTKEESP